MVVPLLDELVHHLLHLPVTLHLQVLDEGVEPPWPVVGLHDGLVRLHNASNPCGQRRETQPAVPRAQESYTGPQTRPKKGSFSPQIEYKSPGAEAISLSLKRTPAMPCVPAALQPTKIQSMKLPQDKATQAESGRGHNYHPNPVPASSTCKVTGKNQPRDGSWAHACCREQALAKARTPWRKNSSPRKYLYNIAFFSQMLYSKS